jgi:hypothetical protein
VGTSATPRRIGGCRPSSRHGPTGARVPRWGNYQIGTRKRRPAKEVETATAPSNGATSDASGHTRSEPHEFRLTVPLFDTSFTERPRGPELEGRTEVAPDIVVARLEEEERARSCTSYSEMRVSRPSIGWRSVWVSFRVNRRVSNIDVVEATPGVRSLPSQALARGEADVAKTGPSRNQVSFTAFGT